MTFRETTTICIERPIGSGEAVEILRAESNPFLATIGLRIDPAPTGSGVEFRLQVDGRTVPLFVYKTVESFTEHMRQYVRKTLQEGLFGWQVTDCIVTMTDCMLQRSRRPSIETGPAEHGRRLPKAHADRRHACARSCGDRRLRANRPSQPRDPDGHDRHGDARTGAARCCGRDAVATGEASTIEMVLPAARAHDLQRRLPGLTGGEGVLESSFAGYQPVSGDQPARQRTTANPLNLGEYMMHLARRVESKR